MVQDRSSLVLYTTAVCNLKCVYCYIDKNPVLVEIDNILDESFKGDYYFNFVKEMFPNPNQLREVQIWGGEPSLRLDRAYYTIEKLITAYPNFNRLMMSTNFTGANFFDQFYGLLKILGSYPDRKFEFDLQLSIDGPTDVNDAQRGKGVTKLFTIHFKKLINTIDDTIPNNVTLNTFFKPTLTADLFSKLQTKDAVINYYGFFEKYYKAFEAKVKNKERIRMGHSIPNTACPSPHTTEEGKLFANFCKICSEISKEIRAGEKYFDFYRDIVPFRKFNLKNFDYSNVHYCDNCGHCGSGHSVIGLLPYHMISACHNGFVDLISDYKEKAQKLDGKVHSIDFKLFMNDSHIMIHDMKSFEIYERMVREFYNKNSTFKLSNMAGLVRILAACGQIDEKYKDAKEALSGAKFVEMSTSYCVRDNIGSTGSMILPPVGMFKLLLNGAREYIEDV